MGGADEVSITRASLDNRSDATSADLDDIGPTGLGAQRAKIVAEGMTKLERWIVFGSLLIFGFAYGLESMLRVVYQPHATSAFANHSTLATVNVLRGVVAAAAYPLVARLSDVFGRLPMVIMSIMFYILGTIIDAKSQNVQSFSAGAVIYQVGFTAVILLVEVVIADITPLKSRLLALYIPTLPLLVNTWISGEVGEAVLKVTTWQWAIGMWAFIIAGASVPLILSLWLPYRRIKNADRLVEHQSPFNKIGPRRLAVALFWHLDVVGILLLIIIFAGILVPFTIAGRNPDQWREAKVITPLVFGLFLIPVWLWWEHRWARASLLPFRLLKDRAVWGALGIAFMLQFCFTLQNNFLYTVLIVAFDESNKSAIRINGLYSFCSVLTGVSLGVVVLHLRYLKPFIVAGTLFFLPAFGVLFYVRGGSEISSHAGAIGAQVFLGFAGGFFPYPAQTLIQAATRHEHLAIITALYLATFNIGSAFGSAVSGAIWTQTLVPTLRRHLPDPYNNDTIARSIFAAPFTYAADYPIGSPMRDAIVKSYNHTQQLLIITGMCLCVPLIVFSLCIRNPRLGNDQSLPNAEIPEHRSQTDGTGRWQLSNLWK
ncbi:putative transporter [Ophiobolus disseminans]|uniref:Transporter n=1 Tax=Ophiobolus disseminans TaxID=1469910 RepID=A0A6A7A3J2_9PLEO|nr:putative transporter [Ophiobolus disseminans]